MATDIGDIVLIHVNGKPAFFARLEAIDPDVKPQWWQVKLLVLQVPLKTITWILREPYWNGDEFTMGGTPIVIEKVVAPELESDEEESSPPPERPDDDDNGGGARVISLADRRRKQD